MSEHLCGAACIVIRLSDVNTCCKHHNRVCPTSITYSPDFCVPDNVAVGDIHPVSKECEEKPKKKKKSKKKTDPDDKRDTSVKKRGKSKENEKTESDKPRKGKTKDSTKTDICEEPKDSQKKGRKGVKSVEKIENPKKKTSTKKENKSEDKRDKKLKKNNNTGKGRPDKTEECDKTTEAPKKDKKKSSSEKSEITKKSSSHTNKDFDSLKEKESEKIKTPGKGNTDKEKSVNKKDNKPVTSHESGDETHKSAGKKTTAPKIEEKGPKKDGKRESKKGSKKEKDKDAGENAAERRRSRSEKGLSRGKYIPNKHCKASSENIEESASVQNMNSHRSRKRHTGHPCNVFTQADRCPSRQTSLSIAAGCKNSFVIKTEVSPCPPCPPCPCPCKCSESESEYVDDRDTYFEDDDGDETDRHKKREVNKKHNKRVGDKHEKTDDISSSNKSHSSKNRKKLTPTDFEEHASKKRNDDKNRNKNSVAKEESSAARKKSKKKENEISSDDDCLSLDESDECSPNDADTYDDASCKNSSTKFIFKIVRDESTANPAGMNHCREELNELEQPRIQPPQIVYFDVENYDQLGLIVKLKPEPSSSSEESLNNNSGRCLYIVLEVDKNKPQDCASTDSDCSPQFSIQESHSSRESLLRYRPHSCESNKSGTQSQSHESFNRDDCKYRNHGRSSDCDCEDNIDECNDYNRRKKKKKLIAKCVISECHCPGSSDSEGDQEHDHVRMRHPKYSHNLSSERTRFHSNEGRSGNCNNKTHSKNIKCPGPDTSHGGRNSHFRDSAARNNEKKRISENNRPSCQDKKNQKDVDAFECCVHDFLKRCHKN